MPDFRTCVSAGLLLMVASSPVQAATQPLPGGVPSFASLSAQQRDQLPDSTRVTVGKHAVTLGALRASHRARSMRIAAAANAGSAAGQAASASKEVHMSLNPGPSKLAVASLVIEPAKEYADNALEMRTFCNAAQATVCLYYPASTTLAQDGGWASEIDPYITDASVCTSQGGHLLVSGCQYSYNTFYHAQFNPGSGFVYKATCNSAYWTLTKVDKHGAIIVDSVIPIGATFATGGTPASCVIRAWVNP